MLGRLEQIAIRAFLGFLAAGLIAMGTAAGANQNPVSLTTLLIALGTAFLMGGEKFLVTAGPDLMKSLTDLIQTLIDQQNATGTVTQITPGQGTLTSTRPVVINMHPAPDPNAQPAPPPAPAP